MVQSLGSVHVCIIILLLLLGTVKSSAPTSPSTHKTAKATAITNNTPTTSQFSSSTTKATTHTSTNLTDKMSDIRIVFSDVDGTLVHYPDSIISDSDAHNNGNRILKLPASATGMQGIISSRTLAMCQDLREQGVKLVLVSGMRTSTLLKRLPFLPKADAYCSEAGGRIFMLRDDNDRKQLSYSVTPESFDGADTNLLEPFEIVEELEWRQKLEDQRAAGTDGYSGAELDLESSDQVPIPIENRAGSLWEFARKLEAKGYVLDTKGYASCFRVNRKQQTSVSDEDFDRLLRGEVLPCPLELATSTNLGCIDYYPMASGKKNCCRYLAAKFLEQEQTPRSSNTSDDDKLSQHCVCMCDDDNDLEMALACQHAFIPGVSSTSMTDVIAKNPDQFSQTGEGHHDNIEGTIATEKALSLILKQIAA